MLVARQAYRETLLELAPRPSLSCQIFRLEPLLSAPTSCFANEVPDIDVKTVENLPLYGVWNDSSGISSVRPVS